MWWSRIVKVLYCNIVPVWPPTMTAVGHTRLVQRLVHAGHEVVAATALYCDRGEAERATGAGVEPFSPFHVDRFSRWREPKYALYSGLFLFHYLRLFYRHGRSFDLICLRNAFVGWCMPLVRRLFRARCVISITDIVSGFLYQNPACPRWLADAAWRVELWIIRRFDTVFCITEEMKRTLVAGGVRADSIVVSGDGVDARVFDPARITPETVSRVDAEIGRDHPRVLFYGNMQRDAVDFLLAIVDAARMVVPTINFVVIGKGDGHDAFVEKVGDRPVTHLGYKPHESLPDYIAACDVGLVPYHRTANSDSILTLKLLEYGAMGLPIVATPLEAIHRLFNGQPWIRFAETPEAMAVALAEMVQRPKDAAQSRFFRENYDWDSIMDAMVHEMEQRARG